jgi:hypothetical protein
MVKAMSLLCCAVRLLVLFTAKAQTQQVHHAYLQIDQLSDTSYVMLWKVPKTNGIHVSIRPVFSNDFNMQTAGSPKQVTGAVLYHYSLHGAIPLAGQTLVIDGLDKTIIEVMVKINYSSGEKVSLVLGPNHRKVVIPGKSGRSKVIRSSAFLSTECVTALRC